MAFAISQNPKPAETPVLEPAPIVTPEMPGVLPVEVAPDVEGQPVVEAVPQTAEERKASDLQMAAELKATMVEKLIPLQSAEAKKAEFEKKIGKILEEDLKKVYTDLPEQVKPTFKTLGENVALEMKALIESEKASGELISMSLRNWLKLVPANGSFFLEQVVKIKTDQLMALAKKMKV